MQHFKEQTGTASTSGSSSASTPHTATAISSCKPCSSGSRRIATPASCALPTFVTMVALVCVLRGLAPCQAASLSLTANGESSSRLISLLQQLTQNGPDNDVETSDAELDEAGEYDLSVSMELSDESYARPKWHHKRHSDFLYVSAHLHETDDDLEWYNPCGGIFEPTGAPAGHIPMRHYLKLLRDSAHVEYTSLRERLHNISIKDIASWANHKGHYRFLPMLHVKPNQPPAQQPPAQQPTATTATRSSNIALKRWYRNMQVYVATFAYLGRTQHKWERSKQLPVSETSRELNELLISARRILCELEMAINGSYPANSKEKLTNITREDMSGKLSTLITKMQQREHSTPIDVATADLKFSKYRYYKFLLNLWRSLESKLQRNGEHIQLSNSSQRSREDSQSDSLQVPGPLPSRKELRRAAKRNELSAASG